MYGVPGRSLSSCELVERHDQDKAGSNDIAHRQHVVVQPYLFEETSFGEEIAGGVLTDRKILGSW